MSTIQFQDEEYRVAMIRHQLRLREEERAERDAAARSIGEFAESVRRETSIIGRLRRKLRRAA